MATTVSPVDVYAGDNLRLEYHLLAAVGEPADLSAWTFTAQWRKSPSSTTAIDLDVDASDSDTGIIIITASPEQTTAMGMSGTWDLQGVNDDQVYTFLRGATNWTKDVTRA